MKYAFHSEARPVINLKIGTFGKQQARVIVSDNGPGIDKSKARDNSIGLELIYSLVEQLDGSIVFQNKKGTEVTIEFILQS